MSNPHADTLTAVVAGESVIPAVLDRSPEPVAPPAPDPSQTAVGDPGQTQATPPVN